MFIVYVRFYHKRYLFFSTSLIDSQIDVKLFNEFVDII